jgi:hypothetical protein
LPHNAEPTIEKILVDDVYSNSKFKQDRSKLMRRLTK